MGTYTPPSDYFAGDIVTASDFNLYVFDNLEALKTPANASVTTVTTQDVTSTTFTDLTAMTVNITPSHASGTCILEVSFNMTVRPSASSTIYNVWVDLLVGGTSVSSGVGVAQIKGNTDQFFQVSQTRIVTGVSTGVKTVKLQAKVDSGATARFHIGSALSYLGVIER
jgi:hypothetical protein